MEIQKEQFLMASDYDLFFKPMSQAEKIVKIEKLVKKNHQLPQEELKNLIYTAINKKDIHMLGYCLAHEENQITIDKDELFLYACEKDFILGVQLIASEINLQKTKYSVEHGNKEMLLINHGLLAVIANDNPKPGMRFLINQGADVRFDNDYLFLYAYEKNYMKAVEYLIREKNIPIDVLFNFLKEKDVNNDKLNIVKEIFTQHQYEQTQNVFVMKELPANVTRKKL